MLESLSQNLTFVIEEGLVVMLTGMGAVFVFLVILVIAMFIMGAIVAKLNKLFPIKVIEAAPARKQSVSIGEDIAVAIAAALSRR